MKQLSVKKQSLIFLSVFLCCSGFSFAEEIDALLQKYNQQNDLSQKTIDKNKGHLILFTRERLEKMHAKTLKDVFKTTPIIYYHENRYALPDPLSSGDFELYRSNFIRLYIDGVEVTQGWMGSGIMLYGNINIDFVDHIEFYYISPSFETSVEPAYLTIFLYSKEAKQENGGKLDLIVGSRGYNSQSISFAQQVKDLSYMVNFSHTDAQREKVPNGTSFPLSRDFEQTQLFSYVKTDKQTFHLQAIKKQADSLAGLSYDATPLVSQADYLNIHMDYTIEFSENWKAQFAYDWLKIDSDQEDDHPLVRFGRKKKKSTTKNSTYSAELTYRETINEHHILSGVKTRFKELDSITLQGMPSPSLSFTRESVLSAFFQDQYLLSEAQLLTFGLEYTKIYRNGPVEDDTLLQLRLGYLYNGEHFSYKTYIYRTMFALDPVSRYFDSAYFKDIPLQTTLGMTQEFTYTKDNYRANLMLLLMHDEESLVQNSISGDSIDFFTVFNYDYTFNRDNKLYLQLYYAYYKNIFNLDKLQDYSGYLSFLNSYEDMDFYNGLVWHQNSINHKNYFDLTTSLSWNIKEDLTVTLKGENLLDRAKKTYLFRVDPQTHTPLSPLEVSPVDRRFTVEVEYLF